MLTRTRNRLRGAVRTLNQVFNRLKRVQAPDKTFIGRITRGFESLGYQYSSGRLRLAARTPERHTARWHRLVRASATKDGTRRCRRSGCLWVAPAALVQGGVGWPTG